MPATFNPERDKLHPLARLAENLIRERQNANGLCLRFPWTLLNKVHTEHDHVNSHALPRMQFNTPEQPDSDMSQKNGLSLCRLQSYQEDVGYAYQPSDIGQMDGMARKSQWHG